MKLEKIITLANREVKLHFLAMERSLRETGCQLPLWVIPYEEDGRFELPPNATWWEVPEILNWLKGHDAHPTMRKYQCLTTDNYQFVDSDVIFLINPELTLQKVNDFITSCGHWHNPGHTYTDESLNLLKKKSTLWQKFVFNTGQFACDKTLYTFSELKEKAESKGFYNTCLSFPYHEQPGINLLVNTAPVTIRNLTLPPYSMESTWAGDYPEENFESRWNENNKPYLIHWAGCNKDESLYINRLFYKFLSEMEQNQLKEKVRNHIKGRRSRKLLKRIKKFFRS